MQTLQENPLHRLSNLSGLLLCIVLVFEINWKGKKNDEIGGK
jgi:hypothetical protein